MTAGQPTAHDQIAQGLQEHPAKKGMPFNILVTAVEIGGSIALFHLAQRMGANDVVSYLIGSIAPVVSGFMVWAKARKFRGVSAAILAFTARPRRTLRRQPVVLPLQAPRRTKMLCQSRG